VNLLQCHLEPSQFEGKQKLKPDALPTLFGVLSPPKLFKISRSKLSRAGRNPNTYKHPYASALIKNGFKFVIVSLHLLSSAICTSHV